MNTEHPNAEVAIPSIWRRGPVTRNPYHFNAFRIAGVPVDLTERSWVTELISQKRQFMAASPGSHVIEDTTVSESDVNQAELVLSDPRRRFLEELLTHSQPRTALQPLQSLDAMLAEAVREPADKSDAPSPNILVLGRIVCSIWLHQHPPDTAFGSAETCPICPWGGRAI